MAIIKVGYTKAANQKISNAEKNSIIIEGIDCVPMAAKHQFSAIRKLYGKNNGIQAHYIIQSFKANEVSPEKANIIGIELAKKVAAGFDCIVCTHNENQRVYNKIIINSVNFENGKKFHLNGRDGIEQVRLMSDQLCMDNGLSVIEKETAKERYTMVEQNLRSRGEISWKNIIRDAVKYELVHSNSYDNFKQNMQDNHGITVYERGQTVTYRMEGTGKSVRGRKLGMNYELDTIMKKFPAADEKMNVDQKGV